ncbi:topoisomerase DNA-binding C4 zinc finger domain-containing protein, partial [Candidatus Woesearchaeota archaeon]|nr:topoisomerase DNA-binding C4 zinc finger domain-containing protein [Candidatus Woesearchaeota archaeon]
LSGKPCPKCGKGKLVLRKSVYGQFFACDQFPKCRYVHGNGKKPAKKQE